MKPPLSNNYCSTMNIADESVCEVPTSKVTRWINNNDFQQCEDIPRSNSFHSLSTSQMFAYIHKDDNKELSPVLSPDYIDDVKMNIEHLKSVYNATCNEVDNCSMSSPYFDEAHLNQKTDSTNNHQLNPYCDEDTVFNDCLHLNHDHSSLPDYMEERNSHCTSDEQLQNSLSAGLSSLTSSQFHAELPDNLYISEDGFANSLPPLVSNPLFAEGSDVISLKHSQKQLIRTYQYGDSELSKWNSDSGLNTSSAGALESPRYYESSSKISKKINSKTTMHNSTCDSFSVTSVNTSKSGIQTSSPGYYEHPADKNKYKYFGSSTTNNKSCLSELNYGDDSQFCDITTIDTNKCSGPNDYVHLLLSTKNVEQSKEQKI